jgi:hypothetical protein
MGRIFDQAFTAKVAIIEISVRYDRSDAVGLERDFMGDRE